MSFYNSYKITSGIAVGSDEKIFTNLKFKKITNLIPIKEDSLDSIPSYKPLSNESRNIIDNVVQIIRFKETLFLLTWNEIYRVDSINFNTLKFSLSKVGNYLNSSFSSHSIDQQDTNLFDPAFRMGTNIACCVYRNDNFIFFSAYNTSLDSKIFHRKIADSSKDFSLFSISIDGRLPLSTGVKVSAKHKDGNEWELFPFAVGSAFLDTNRRSAATTPSINPPMITSSKIYHNFRKWGDFSYSGNNYHVIWSENDAYFIMNDDGVPLAKIGLLSAPSHDPDFKMRTGNIQVVGDTIYIPVLLASREEEISPITELEDNQLTIGRKIFYPSGVKIIKIRIDKRKPLVNYYEFDSGLLLSGPILKFYDGNSFSEFNFNERPGKIEETLQRGIGNSVEIERNFDLTDQVAEELNTPADITPTGYGKTDDGFGAINGIKSGNNPTHTYTLEKQSDGSYTATGTEMQRRFLGDADQLLPGSGDRDWTRIFLNLNEIQIQTIPKIEQNLSFNNISAESDLGLIGSDFSSGYQSQRSGFSQNAPGNYENVGRHYGSFGISRTPDVGSWNKIAVLKDSAGNVFGAYLFYVGEMYSNENQYLFVNISYNRDHFYGSIGGDDFYTDDGDLTDTMTLEFYDLSPKLVIRKPRNQRTEREVLNSGVSPNNSSLNSLFSRAVITGDPTEFETVYKKLLKTDETESNYSARFKTVGTNLQIQIRNDTSSSEPPDRDKFTSATVKQGTNSANYNLTTGTSRVEENVRIYTVPKGSLTFSADNSDYQILVSIPEVQKWDSTDAPYEVMPPVIPMAFTIQRIEISTDNATVKMFVNDISQFRTVRVRITISGSQGNYNLNQSSIEDDHIVYSRPSQESFPIFELQGSDRTATLNFTISSRPVGSFDFSRLPETTYLWAGFYKWTDSYGREHYSALSEQKRITVFGRVGLIYKQSGAPDETIKQSLKFKNMNFTDKTVDNLTFVLIRARLTENENDFRGSPDSFYRIVKEIPIDLSEEFIEIEDDVNEKDLYGTVSPNSLLSLIIQPPGAEKVAIGRRNRIFIGNVLGFENSVWASNILSNEKVSIFSFLKDNSISPRLFFDNKVLGLENLDTNLLVFTERKIFYLPADTLNPQLIQESENNYCSQPGSIVPWKRGVCFANFKGIHYVGRDFKIYRISKDVEDYVNQRLSGSDVDIFSGYSSEIDRSLRFRISFSEILAYDKEFSKWTIEDSVNGPEIDVFGRRIKWENFGNNMALLASSKSVSNLSKRHTLETGWLNFINPAASILVRNIDLIGSFGNFTSISLQMFYNYDETNYPENHHVISADDLQDRNINLMRFASKIQKFHSIKLIFVLDSNNVSLSAIGFSGRFRKTKDPRVPAGSSF